MPEVVVTRRMRFNAAHRLHNPELSDEENRALFGACSNPNGHGHNYQLDVSVAGEIDPVTGYVIDLKRLRNAVEEHLTGRLDHRNLNLDVEFLRGINPTAENLVVACWRVLEPVLAPARLVHLRLIETENNHVDYGGG